LQFLPSSKLTSKSLRSYPYRDKDPMLDDGSLAAPGISATRSSWDPRREETMDRSDDRSTGLHNIVTLQTVSHVWGGICVHDIRIKALPGRAWHPLNCDQPVLSVVVNELHGRCVARLSLSDGSAARPAGRQRPIGHVSLIPAGVPVWGYSEAIAEDEEGDIVLGIAR